MYFNTLIFLYVFVVSFTINNGTIYLSNKKTQWTPDLSESGNCSAAKVPVNTVDDLSELANDKVWAEAMTEWLVYKGSFTGHLTAGATKRVQIGDKDEDAISKCYVNCGFGTFFFVKTTCVCDGGVSLTGDQCFTNNYPFGSKGTGSQYGENYCMTRFEPVTLNYNVEFDCGTVIYNEALDPEFVSENCSETRHFLYKDSSNNNLEISSELLNWRESVKWSLENRKELVDYDFVKKHKNSRLIVNIKYWIVVFRKPVIKTIVEPRRCRAFVIDEDEKLKSLYSECSESLPVLCIRQTREEVSTIKPISEYSTTRGVSQKRATEFVLSTVTTPRIVATSIQTVSGIVTTPWYQYIIYSLVAVVCVVVVLGFVCACLKKRAKRFNFQILSERKKRYESVDLSAMTDSHLEPHYIDICDLNIGSYEHVPCSNDHVEYDRVLRNNSHSECGLVPCSQNEYDHVTGNVSGIGDYGRLNTRNNKIQHSSNIMDYDTMATIRADAGVYGDTTVTEDINNKIDISDYDSVKK